MFVLLFRYVFGGAIHVPGISYVDFLIPGIIVQTVIFGATSTAVGLSQDMSKGIIDRFRSLPMSRSAALAGRTIADLARNVFVVLLMIVVGILRARSDSHSVSASAPIAFGTASPSSSGITVSCTKELAVAASQPSSNTRSYAIPAP